jgi:hypothetical protein
MIITVISSDKTRVTVYRTGLTHIGTATFIDMDDNGCVKTEKTLIRRDATRIWSTYPLNVRDGESKLSPVNPMVQNALTTPVHDLLKIMGTGNPSQADGLHPQGLNMGPGFAPQFSGYNPAAYGHAPMQYGHLPQAMENTPLHASFSGLTTSDSNDPIQLGLNIWAGDRDVPMWARMAWIGATTPISIAEEELLSLIDQHIN